MKSGSRVWLIGMLVLGLIALVACNGEPPPPPPPPDEPGPKKVIVVKPQPGTGSSTTLGWNVDNIDADVDNETSATMHTGFLQEVGTFEVAAGEPEYTAKLESVTFKILNPGNSNPHTLVVGKDAGKFTWTLTDPDGAPVTLSLCNTKTDDIEDCAPGSLGVPKEFFGKLQSIDGVRVDTAPFPAANWARVKMAAPDQQE